MRPCSSFAHPLTLTPPPLGRSGGGVGAGFSGLYMLHRLRQAGFRAVVLEAGSGVGGAAREHRGEGRDEIVGVGDMREDVVAEDEVGLAAERDGAGWGADGSQADARLLD